MHNTEKCELLLTLTFLIRPLQNENIILVSNFWTQYRVLTEYSDLCGPSQSWMRVDSGMKVRKFRKKSKTVDFILCPSSKMSSSLGSSVIRAPFMRSGCRGFESRSGHLIFFQYLFCLYRSACQSWHLWWWTKYKIFSHFGSIRSNYHKTSWNLKSGDILLLF